MDDLLGQVPELPLLVLALVAVVVWRAARRAAAVLLVVTVLVLLGGIAAHGFGPALCYPAGPGSAILGR